ncbi:MAG TPA: hypothetical protein ENI38_03770 [Candidatus Acetothermia bacterium]|nr:hypothetical protein [Candidatus Acetothermia bacterium]
MTSQVAVAVLISLGGPEEEQVRLAGYAAGGGVHVLEVGPGVVETYRLLRTPTFFLVDGEGVIVWAKEGFSSEAELVVEIRGILAGLASQGEHPEN